LLREAYSRFARTVPQWHSVWTPGIDPVSLEAGLPRDTHMVIEATASSREEALALSEKLARIAQR